MSTMAMKALLGVPSAELIAAVGGCGDLGVQGVRPGVACIDGRVDPHVLLGDDLHGGDVGSRGEGDVVVQLGGIEPGNVPTVVWLPGPDLDGEGVGQAAV